MFGKLRRVRPAAWCLLGLVAALSTFSILTVTKQIIPSAVTLYAVQPTAAVIIAAIAHMLTRGRRSQVRHAKDKAIVIGSIMAIWFVAYFATGVFLTYVHNALFSTPLGLLLNIIGFGVTAAAVEYTRHCTLILAGRRNAVWFGVLVTIIFAIQQVNLSGLATAPTAEDFVKLIISNVIPSFISSALLTYLALTSGLPAMLTYRLGLVAMTILPPITPKVDWYLVGVSSILLAIIVYLVTDKTQQTGRQPRTRRHINRAIEITWLCAIIALTLFMSGFFAYKPSAIMSNSMVPVFSRGSMVIVQRVGNIMDISIGDIIQYETRGITVTHRVIAINQASDGSGSRVFTTKGDNNPSRDMPVAESHVHGVVRAQIPYIGYPTVWLRELTVGNQSNQVNK